MHQTERRHAAGVLQIQVVSTDLIGQQQAFVNDGAAAHAGHVILFAVLQAQFRDGFAGFFTNDVELAFQGILHDDIAATTDEHLAQNRFFGPHAGRHGHVLVDGDIAPAQAHLAFGFDGTFHLLFASQTRSVLFGQKNHTHPVLALGR